MKKLAILHSKHTLPDARDHLILEIANLLPALGVEVIHLYGTQRFVPADAVLVHVDLSIVPDAYARFAQRYPKTINAVALDIRKSIFVDGLLGQDSTYGSPVIVKSDLNYGGAPEHAGQPLATRLLRRIGRLLSGKPAPKINSKADYRIFPALADVPAEFFTPDNVVQRLVLEKDGNKNLLREYIFLADVHFESLERSASEIITDDEHISCRQFDPHPRLLNLRRLLKLDYGKIDYVMEDGIPFIFDANKTLGVGPVGVEFAQDWRDMMAAFAAEIARILASPDAGNTVSLRTDGGATPT